MNDARTLRASQLMSVEYWIIQYHLPIKHLTRRSLFLNSCDSLMMLQPLEYQSFFFSKPSSPSQITYPQASTVAKRGAVTMIQLLDLDV